MKIKSNIGDKIRQVRKDKGLFQDDLADALNIKRQTISSWEKGRTEPNYGEIRMLAAALNCTVEELVGDYSSNIHTINLYNQLTNENRALVNDFVQMLYDKQIASASK